MEIVLDISIILSFIGVFLFLHDLDVRSKKFYDECFDRRQRWAKEASYKAMKKWRNDGGFN